MPVIPPHHQDDPWRPLRPWPDDCHVQWGGSGLVVRDRGSYGTAFFEVFPADGVAGFIRGEGEDVASAEAAAFAIYEREAGCFHAGGHRMSRAKRLGESEARLRNGRRVPMVSTNLGGGTHCVSCGAFALSMQPVHAFGEWRRPLGYGELGSIMDGGLRPDPDLERRYSDRDRPRMRRHKRRLALRASLFGLELPDPALPQYRMAKDASPLARDPYREDCRRAVVRFYVERRGTPAGPDAGGESGLFDFVHKRNLEREAEAYLASA